MKITFLNPGAFKSKELDSIYQYYLKLIGKYFKVEDVALKIPKRKSEIQTQSGLVLDWLKSQKGSLYLVLLDENGELFNTREFSKNIEKLKNSSLAQIVFATSGAHGFEKKVSEKADLLWSLSPLTFPHEMARVIAAEQVFRALSVIHGHPYHND